MYRLLGNGKLLEKCETLLECLSQAREYKKIDRIINGNRKIKFKIEREK